MKRKLIISCEHASNAIPREYKALFSGYTETMQSHRAYDIGAKSIFDAFRDNLNIDYSKQAHYSRLLIELNRSMHHPDLFSSITKNLPKKEKERIVSHYYKPFRNDVENKIKGYIEKGFEVIHLSIHTFTPHLNGIERNAAIGLLYDPKRKAEKEFCRNWKNNLASYKNDLTLRFNYPYKGTADGFTTYLRKKFPFQYLGIELEVNNKYANRKEWDSMKEIICQSFKNSFGSTHGKY